MSAASSSSAAAAPKKRSKRHYEVLLSEIKEKLNAFAGVSPTPQNELCETGVIVKGDHPKIIRTTDVMECTYSNTRVSPPVIQKGYFLVQAIKDPDTLSVRWYYSRTDLKDISVTTGISMMHPFDFAVSTDSVDFRSSDTSLIRRRMHANFAFDPTTKQVTKTTTCNYFLDEWESAYRDFLIAGDRVEQWASSFGHRLYKVMYRLFGTRVFAVIQSTWNRLESKSDGGTTCWNCDRKQTLVYGAPYVNDASKAICIPCYNQINRWKSIIQVVNKHRTMYSYVVKGGFSWEKPSVYNDQIRYWYREVCDLAGLPLHHTASLRESQAAEAKIAQLKYPQSNGSGEQHPVVGQTAATLALSTIAAAAAASSPIPVTSTPKSRANSITRLDGGQAPVKRNRIHRIADSEEASQSSERFAAATAAAEGPGDEDEEVTEIDRTLF